MGFPLIKVSAPELVAGVSGESEERIRDLFDQAVSIAPCVLFLDEIDAITPNRNNAQREMERRIVAQLLTTLDGNLSQNQFTDLILWYIILKCSIFCINRTKSKGRRKSGACGWCNQPT